MCAVVGVAVLVFTLTVMAVGGVVYHQVMFRMLKPDSDMARDGCSMAFAVMISTRLGVVTTVVATLVFTFVGHSIGSIFTGGNPDIAAPWYVPSLDSFNVINLWPTDRDTALHTRSRCWCGLLRMGRHSAPDRIGDVREQGPVMEARANGRLAVLVAAALVFALLAGQWAVAATSPPTGVADTGRLGKTGFAYLGGIRTFAAAALWNHLDPQFDGYYSGSLKKAVSHVAHDVHGRDSGPAVHAGVSSGVDWSSEQAIRSRESRSPVREWPTTRTPESCTPISLSYCCSTTGANRKEALANAQEGVRPGTLWANSDEEYEGLATIRGVLNALGATDAVPAISARLDRLRAGDPASGSETPDGGKQGN